MLTQEQFTQANIQTTMDAFYESGQHNARRLFGTMDRCGIDYSSFRTCIDYGCGVGRVTRWLAGRFERVFAYDISQAHLEVASSYLVGQGIQNVSLAHLTQVQDVEHLARVDLIYSLIVLQHNPPPVIAYILRRFIRALNPGGVAFFQVPTYRLGYSFSLNEYLANHSLEPQTSEGLQEGRATSQVQVKEPLMEMHLLPQSTIFEILRQEGARVVDMIEDGWTGSRYQEVSNTFLVQKLP